MTCPNSFKFKFFSRIFLKRNFSGQLNSFIMIITLLYMRYKMWFVSPMLLTFMSGFFGIILAKDECYTNGDCFDDFRHLRIVCCKNSRDSDRICQPYNCEGRYCLTHGDCGGEGECCIKNKCNNTKDCPRCNSTSDCANSEYCCKQAYGNICRRSCVGERCAVDSDCAVPGEYCDTAYKICVQPIKTTSSSERNKKPGGGNLGQTTQQQNIRPNTLNSFITTESFPGWAIGYIVFGIIVLVLVAVQIYLVRDRFKRNASHSTQSSSVMDLTNEVAMENERSPQQRATRSPSPILPYASTEVQTASRAPASIPSIQQQTACRNPPPIPSYSLTREQTPPILLNPSTQRQTTSRAPPPIPSYSLTREQTPPILLNPSTQQETATRPPPSIPNYEVNPINTDTDQNTSSAATRSFPEHSYSQGNFI